eukprot:CAMPEP_0194189098 /NCGR_PEP_ID=MMETSP0154-20130528/57573_1 /TAXON_ID=1049557 /ORGANISM="Thalassiothrix antarctica, Strain L6-D1" /LENGTH=473 /DNA_ID=CAMNT_0038910033 /DNA_START=1 /DNA_END=1419 /DNA_ORIENTATION=+
MMASHSLKYQEKNRKSITILVLGDEEVGKSSLISTFVARHFSEAVPSVMTRIRLPPDLGTQVVTTICDSKADKASAMLSTARSNGSLTFLSSQQKEYEKIGTLASNTTTNSTVQQKGVDSIILVYDLHKFETFVRLENHWLPLIERHYNGKVPVIVAGNKLDLFLQTETCMAENPLSAQVQMHQHLVPLLQRFHFVRECIRCSAKNLLCVQEVFVKAQEAILYPLPPIFDTASARMTKKCKKAFTRIFRMYDKDNDGLLSNSELNDFQHQTFLVPLGKKDLAGWTSNIRWYAEEEEVVRDGKLTLAGFLALFVFLIDKNCLGMPWKVLRKFGYSDSLDLTIPKHFQGINFPSLSTASREFLMALFNQFDSDMDGILSSDDIKDIFSIISEPALPPWYPVRAKRLLKGCFSFPKDTYERKLPEDSSTKNPLDKIDFSLSAGGIIIASATPFHSVSKLCSSFDGVTLPPMTQFDW